MERYPAVDLHRVPLRVPPIHRLRPRSGCPHHSSPHPPGDATTQCRSSTKRSALPRKVRSRADGRQARIGATGAPDAAKDLVDHARRIAAARATYPAHDIPRELFDELWPAVQRFPVAARRELDPPGTSPEAGRQSSPPPSIPEHDAAHTARNPVTKPVAPWRRRSLIGDVRCCR